MESTENQRRSRPLTHAEKMKFEHMDEFVDQLNSADSGFGSLTDKSVTDSYSMSDQSRNLQCSIEGDLLQKTQQLNLVDEPGKSDLLSSVSCEKKSIDSGFPMDSIDGQNMYPVLHPEVYFHWFMSSFAQNQDLRYLLAPLWPLLIMRNDDGDTSLHLAIINCHEQLILAILDVLPRSKYFDMYNNLIQTPLHLAVITRQPKIVQKLIDYGARVDLVDRNGQTCIHHACLRGDMHSLRAIFKYRPGKVEFQEKLHEILETRNFDGLTPLCVAVKANHIEIVKELIKLGADVNASDSKSGNTALHLAVEDNNLPMVSCLLFQGNANPNAMSYNDSTPLHLAAGLELETITATLIAMGASASIENMEGDTAFRMASESFENFSEDDDLDMEN